MHGPQIFITVRKIGTYRQTNALNELGIYDSQPQSCHKKSYKLIHRSLILNEVKASLATDAMSFIEPYKER